MAGALETVTNLIQSPPGQLACGAVLAGIVWKFFERVESVLTDDTKLEIAVWLLSRKHLENTVRPVKSIFYKIFGEQHLSWKCFRRSVLATLTAVLICHLTLLPQFVSGLHEVSPNPPIGNYIGFSFLVLANWLVLCGFDYVSLFETRYLLRMLRTHRNTAFLALVLLVDILATSLTGLAPAYLVTFGATLHPVQTLNARVHEQEISDERNLAFFREEVFRTKAAHDVGKASEYVQAIESMKEHPAYAVVRQEVLSVAINLWIPTFFTSIWLWLYVGSGLLLKAARRFDIGFDWFNCRFDIEKKPLQSIGLVAGAVVAVVYWVAVVVSRAV